MSLTSAMNTAQAIFNNTGKQTQTVSKNMANAQNPDYVRRSSVTTTSLYGAQIMSTTRAQNDMLLRQILSSTSQNSAQQALLKGLSDIKSVLGGNDNESAPSAYLGKFQTALHDYANKPNDQILGAAAINAAKDVANSLNTVSKAVQAVRTDADSQIATQVDKLNGLLAQFQVANEAVTRATALGDDPSDGLDVREGLLKQISEIVGVSTMAVENNGQALYTTSGIALFDKTPRKVEFTPRPAYDANTAGNAIKIDGVTLTAGGGSSTSAMGSLQALLQVRDEIAPTFQKQLDEIARALTTSFAEVDGYGATVAGLFTWSGVSAAASIRVAQNAIDDPKRLRDGTVNGGDGIDPLTGSVSQNSAGNAGYSTLLDKYETGLDANRSFDPAAGLDSNTSIMKFATRSVSWLETYRSGANAAAESKSALLSRTTEAYSSVTSVSLDEEMSLMLDIEQSYKASAKLVNAVDEMLKALLSIAS
ncbi:MAG: flagellar hook-associated protein FlgK [Rhizobiales bacterium 63-7]|nr:flagellar hook-associated protein FlgK [Hyphomicrobiales bacterium]OJU72367.1 MAG: flagellar hook-associated protein FlgK [Rhizobiales bacterium 63-7]